MLKRTFKPQKKNKQKGMAVIEAIPVLFMLVMIFNFSLGFFGAIHSGILNSIGAYNYAFETFRYRSNLMYFRPGVDNKNYKLSQSRVHGVTQDGSEQSAGVEDKGTWPATVRYITFNFSKDDASRNLAGAQDREGERGYRNRDNPTNIWHVTSTYTPDGGGTIQTPRIWIKTVYGMCINADCTGSGDSQKDRTGE